jgi:hypothetical protein
MPEAEAEEGWRVEKMGGKRREVGVAVALASKIPPACTGATMTAINAKRIASIVVSARGRREEAGRRRFMTDGTIKGFKTE